MPGGPTNAQFEVALSFRDKATGRFIKATDSMVKSVKRQATETQRNHKRIEQSARRMATSYSQGMKSMRLSTSGLREVVGRLRNQLLLIAFTYQLFQRVIKPTIDLAMKQEFAERKLEAAFLGSGQATKVQVQALKDLANQLQATTMFSNEAIINAQAMLATFQLNAEQVGELSERMLDMATAITDVTGKEANLQAVAIALGKGVTGNIGILSRYGVVLSAEAKRTGDFTLIMKELDANFKGIAQSMQTTFMGQMKMSGNVVGDFQKELGYVITQSAILIASLDLFRVALIGTTASLKEAREQTDNFAKGWKNFIHTILTTVAVLKTFWAGFRQGIRVLILFIGKVVELAMKIPFLASRFKIFNETIKEFNKLIEEELVEGAKDLDTIWDGLASQFTKLELKMQELSGMSTEIWDKMKESIKNMVDSTKKEFDNMKTVLKDVENSLSAFFYDVMIGEMKTVEDYWKTFTQSILKSWTRMLGRMLTEAMFWEAAMATFKLLMNAFSGGVGSAAAGAVKAAAPALTTMHKGGEIPSYQRGGEVLVKALPGEGVITRRGMAGIGTEGLARINRGEPLEGRGTVINQYYINAIDVKTFRDYLAENEDIYVASIQGNIESGNSLRKLFRSGI